MLLTQSLVSRPLTNGWSVCYFQEFESLCLDDSGELTSELLGWFEKIVDRPDGWNSFRQQIRLKSTPVLLAVIYEERKLRIAGPRLGNELFLLNLIESNEYRGELQTQRGTQLYTDVKEHVEAIATLDPRQFPSQYDWAQIQYGLVDLCHKTPQSLSAKIASSEQKLIKELLANLNRYRPVLFEKVSDFGLGLTAQYALLRIHLLKFLAILPSLDHDKSGNLVKKILLESFRRLLKDSKKARALKKKGQERALPKRLFYSLAIVKSLATLLPAKPLAQMIRASVRFMARRFIAGESIEEAQHSFQQLFTSGRDVTLDQLGELVVSEQEADHYKDEVLKLIRGFAQHIPVGEKNSSGILRAHVSIKVSALCSHFKPAAPEVTFSAIAPRLREILLTAKEHQVFLNIDAEHYHYRDIVFDIYQRVLLETPELYSFKDTGIVLQAYLRDASEHLDEIIALAKKRGHLMPIRLVKGAYWDAETVEAEAHSYNAPQFLNKEETDLNFRQMIVKIFENGESIQLCLASHNFADHCFARALQAELYPKAPVPEHQCLHMTYEALSTSLAKMGWATRNYVPIGSLIVGMAYLVRRIMENSSQVGVLTIMRSHKKPASLKGAAELYLEKKEKKLLERDLTQEKMTDKFFNIAPVRTYLKPERLWVEQALKTFKEKSLGKTYQNSFKLSGEQAVVMCSSDPSLKVGEIQFANAQDAAEAVKTLDSALTSEWCKSTGAAWLLRVNTLARAAYLMSARRNQLAALIVYEAGKTVVEALGDVDEAIDFIHFYIREEARLQKHSQDLSYRGPTAVISPWNFPLAIPCGMVTASLVAGNPVVLKSAEQTPLICAEMVALYHEAGVPENCLIHLPGLGEIVGEALVQNSKIAGIVFTGSKNVGLSIARKAQSRLYHHSEQNLSYPVRVVSEMGGKNAIIVTSSAELDETVSGILASAFGHSGQKCSAASRVIVHEAVIERLKERLKEAIKALEIGKAFDFATDVNPLITLEDRDRVRKIVQEAKLEVERHGGTLVIDRSSEETVGYAVGPALFEVSYEQSLNSESWSQKEIFGPVLHLIKVRNLDQALEVFNATEYALTGGVFSQSQDEIDYLTSRMECGNLYINRNITGARVGIEPFGGFKLSGTGPKAGGRGYLPGFHLQVPRFEIPKGQKNLGNGSDYQFDLARPSGLTVEARATRLNNVLERLHSQYEVFFKEVDGDQKAVLARFQKWVAQNLVSFQLREHQNRKIPGQLSFNDYQMVQEHALVIASSEKPAFITLMQVMSAVAMGTGVSIVTRTEEAYAWWNLVIETFHHNGFSKENLDVYFSSNEGLKKALEEEKISTVILDGELESFLSILFPTDMREKRMRALLTPFDAADPDDFKRLCEHYVCMRSFAVNTMRHGAPLDLELS